MQLYHTGSGWCWIDDHCRLVNQYLSCIIDKEMIMKIQNLKSKIQNAELPLMEHFYTLQGEGFHQGRAAYFIRLGGCDVGCTWCDVKDSWDVAKHPLLKIEDLI